MKKALWIFLPLLLIVAGIYLFIPGTIRIRQEIAFVVNTNAFTRKFPEYKQWQTWWPGEATNSVYRFNNKGYQVTQSGLTALRIAISDSIHSIPSELIFIPLNDSTIRLQWNVLVSTSNNPLQRIKRFVAAQTLTKDVAKILEHIRDYYSQPVNVYGITVERDRVRDSSLISITKAVTDYPSVNEVYSLVEKLQAYAKSEGAQQSGLPMLNVSNIDSSNYRVQVAIPIDRQLPGAGDIDYKWMLGGGNILVAEIMGGPYTISQGFKQMAEYAEDHRRYAPAINYQSLVTDRRKEPDTAKWVTKLYWPVM